MTSLTFKEIPTILTKELIMTKHYAQRMPSISWAFGAYHNDNLIGVVTFGKPASNALCIGVCGEEHRHHVYELNRLILIERPVQNIASQLVGYALKQLKPFNLIIVSYADTDVHHTGYVYQATNFLYTGFSAKRTDKYTPLGKHSRHTTNDDDTKHLRVVRSPKHRYIYFACDKSTRNCFKKY